MEIAVTPGAVDADLTAFAVLDPVGDVPGGLDPRLPALVASGELRGTVGATCVLHGERGRIVAAGGGRRDQLDSDSIRDAAAAVARLGLGGTVAWLLDDRLGLSPDEQARAAVDGLILGGYDPGAWKTDGSKPKPTERLVLVGADDAVLATATRAARVAEWANRARDLANRPPNDLTPERLADRAAEIAQGSEHLSYESLGRAGIEALGMGAFAAVAQGSHNDPRLIVLRYDPPGARDDLVLGLVGKAITFDTGGISLKTADYMEDMKGDMSGGAAVIEGIGAVVELGLPVRILGVVASTENMAGGGAYRPGDILTAMNGTTIEVINTDCEGRLVLADALCYAREQGATHLIDMATLTGAMVFALGDLYAGVFADDDGWRDQILDAANASGDHLWPMPLHRRYRRYVTSNFADLKNGSILREGSPALAAEFLHEFVGDGPWAHIDLAGPAFIRRSRGDYLSQQGGTGYGVRLIAELAGRLAT
ncbi:MAG TPA: leucyl aminopeptidase [Gaiellaceae bacterium]|nr:leucyl aminopeptidase [Gaiellaceae bacterium]